MTSFKSFEEIQAWQESRKLTKKIRLICKRETVRKDFSFADQITSSARSISYNIAEGFDSQTNHEFKRFLGYSKRSCAEVRSQLYDAIDENYITKAEFDELMTQATTIGKMLYGLIKHLHTHSNRITWH